MKNLPHELHEKVPTKTKLYTFCYILAVISDIVKLFDVSILQALLETFEHLSNTLPCLSKMLESTQFQLKPEIKLKAQNSKSSTHAHLIEKALYE